MKGVVKMESNVVSKELCEKEHKSVDERFDRHEKWLGEHEEKIDELQKSDVKNTTEIQNLCKQIADLVNTLRWLIGILVVPFIGGLIGFFFYAIQHGLFK